MAVCEHELARLTQLADEFLDEEGVSSRSRVDLLQQLTPSPNKAAWLTAVVVEEKSRGQGVGSALVARAEEWAVEHGALRISLTSALHRESAHEFYKARDYEHTGVRLTKVFVNRSGTARRGKRRSSRTAVADDARNQSRG